MPPLHIAIAGAGTAGLAAAAFLTRDGHRVTLFERFAEPRPVGAGLMVQPTGLACLAMLGLDRAAIEQGEVIARLHGETVGGTRIFDVAYAEIGPRVFGLAMHRAALFAVLHDKVRQLGIPMVPSTDVASSRSVAGGGRVLVDATGNEHGPFDLVVDATGMRSALRRGEMRFRFEKPCGYGAIWGIVAEPNGWPHKGELRQRYDGCHVMIGILPVGRAPGDARRLTALFWSLRVADYPAMRAAGVEAWKARLIGLWPESAPFVDQVHSLDQMTLASYADIAVREPFAPRLVCIGDAARSTSPQLGQGANLALIDAVTLADSLRTHAAAGIDAALADYARRRRTHTRFYSLASRWLTPFFQSDSRAAAALRDAIFPLMAHVPYLRREMVRTLSGMKTGLFTHLDPGQWHADYALARTRRIAAA
jgi:2-polyprenyl-6-methoxyphenol hydroxylase-like FAD-dependent oxidoreductase